MTAPLLPGSTIGIFGGGRRSVKGFVSSARLGVIGLRPVIVPPRNTRSMMAASGGRTDARSTRVLTSCNCGSLLLPAAPTAASALVPPTAPTTSTCAC